MSYFDPNGLHDLFDYLVLNALSNGPQMLPELQARLRSVSVYLDLVAARTGVRTSPETWPAKLEQLERDGWLETQVTGTESSGFQIRYSLTEIGEQRIQQERQRREKIVSRFVEEANLDDSFRRFLNDQGTFGSR